jgi:lipopolysaccharide transport system ATP-binding protein
MSNYAVKVEGLSKQYKIGGQARYRTLRSDVEQAVRHVLGRSRTPSVVAPKDRARQGNLGNRVWALRDLTFEIPAGRSTGIIGSNGAGKTTLLKILAHITAPTQGRARLYGRVGSLLEVGTGFHPELTGRENIYLNGAILGMRKQEIDRKFDEIVSFSEIELYLDTPVKFYSSGMGVRLAFSVAAHLEPEILLLDEVLAVGDVNFQKKSLNKMGDVVRGGRTVLFVSHNLAAVKSLCDSAIYLEHGELKFYGDVDEAVEAYLSGGELQNVQQFERPVNTKLPMQIMSVGVQDQKGNLVARVPHDQPFSVRIQMVARETTNQIFPSVEILDGELDAVIHSDHFAQSEEAGITSYKPGSYTFLVKVPAPLLIPGNYRVSINLSHKSRRFTRIVDRVEHVCPFEIFDNGSLLARYGHKWSGKIALPLDWECTLDDAR